MKIPRDLPPWLVLMFHLRGRSTAARVRIWRHLQRVGALPVKNSGYVLPRSDSTREDLEWVRADIVGVGGDAMIVAASTLAAADDAELRTAFIRARTADFDSVTAAAKRIGKAGRKRSAARPAREVRALADRMQHLERIDFFGAPNRSAARAAVEALVRSDQEGTMTVEAQPLSRAADFKRRIWITRPRPGIDRCASAWLVRRYIDPSARFVFAESPDAKGIPVRKAVAFDMYGAEFGHHAGACTFETLLARFGIDDPAAAWLGRIVHAVDLKVDDAGAPEAAAVGRLIEGLRSVHQDDLVLLNKGMELIEALYRSYIAPSSTAARKRAGGRRR